MFKADAGGRIHYTSLWLRYVGVECEIMVCYFFVCWFKWATFKTLVTFHYTG